MWQVLAPGRTTTSWGAPAKEGKVRLSSCLLTLLPLTRVLPRPFASTAGPGSYNLAVSTGKQILSDNRTAGTAKFSQAPLAASHADKTDSPGPIYELAMPQSGYNVKIGRALRQGLFADCDTNGCANYRMESMTSIKRGGGAKIGTEKRMRSSIPLNHQSPGFVYNPQDVVNFRSGPSFNFGRASKRFGSYCDIDNHR